MQLNPSTEQRYNSHNVDLNRNVILPGDIIPQNDKDVYEIAQEIKSQSGNDPNTAKQLWQKRFTTQSEQKANIIMQGQYTNETQLEYGGNPYSLEPEHTQALAQLDETLTNARINRKRCLLVDFHTGVGKPCSIAERRNGDGYMLICNAKESMEKLPADLKGKAKIPYKISGGVARGYTAKLDLCMGCAMEFATNTTQEDVFANLVARPNQMPQEIFYPQGPWRAESITQACSALDSLVSIFYNLKF